VGLSKPLYYSLQLIALDFSKPLYYPRTHKTGLSKPLYYLRLPHNT
jgi:hypothetical protein